mmetsp:Transcript_33005/g.32358  ORF Transcript_33005/g.32358 Transcript_33005/m.32358 type:complete len:122 (-) Transcript_33005:879-1244(-)
MIVKTQHIPEGIDKPASGMISAKYKKRIEPTPISKNAMKTKVKMMVPVLKPVMAKTPRTARETVIIKCPESIKIFLPNLANKGIATTVAAKLTTPTIMVPILALVSAVYPSSKPCVKMTFE